MTSDRKPWKGFITSAIVLNNANLILIISKQRQAEVEAYSTSSLQNQSHKERETGIVED